MPHRCLPLITFHHPFTGLSIAYELRIDIELGDTKGKDGVVAGSLEGDGRFSFGVELNQNFFLLHYHIAELNGVYSAP